MFVTWERFSIRDPKPRKKRRIIPMEETLFNLLGLLATLHGCYSAETLLLYPPMRKLRSLRRWTSRCRIGYKRNMLRMFGIRRGKPRGGIVILRRQMPNWKWISLDGLPVSDTRDVHGNQSQSWLHNTSEAGVPHREQHA
jgi:hypothetical protein